MTVMYRLALTANFVTLLSLAAPALADDGSATYGLTKTAPSNDRTSETSIRAGRGFNQNRVDGAKSTRTTSQSVAVGVNQGFGWGGLALEVEQLNRDIEEPSFRSESTKSTSIITPGVNVKVSPTFLVTAGFSIYRTDVDNDLVPGGEYDLNTQRSLLRGTWLYGKGDPGEGDSLSLTLASEARAEKIYQIQGYPSDLVDRDYIPAQAEIAYKRHVNDRLDVTASTRYSHYNKDVYEDMYDSDVPSTPTLAQVFDYLLSFKAAARFAVTNTLAFVGEVGRKAALDTNAYIGDEYLVGTGGAAGVELEIGPVDAGLKYMTSNGRKTHEANGQSYDYANRQSAAVATLAVSM